MPKVTLYPTAIERISLPSSNITNKSLQAILNKGPSQVTTPSKINIDIRPFADTNIIFSMDWSLIPAEATITKMILTTKGQANLNTKPVQVSQSALFVTEAIPWSVDKNVWGYPWQTEDISKPGGHITFTKTLQTHTVNYTLMPTREKLNTLKVMYFAARGITWNLDYTVQFYGFQVDIEYTLPQPKNVIMTKLNGTWIPSSEFYKKINGIWVKQTDINTLFEQNHHYWQKKQ